MLLKIGKKYITLNGAIVTVDSLLENTDHYAFNCTIKDATGDYQESAYTPNGYYWSDQRDHEWNIVSEAPFKLKAGKRYKTRSGFVTTPLVFDNETETLYKFIGTAEGITRSWTEEGRWVVTSSEEEHDLIEEYIGEKYSGIKLEVGVKYLTRGGSVITLIDHNDNGFSFMGSNDYIYTLGYGGSVFYDEESEGDIVGLAPEPSEYDVVKLKVGVKYLMRSGDTVVLHDCGSKTDLEGDNGYYYSHAFGGFVFDDEETTADIVGLAPEPLEEVNVDEMARDFDFQWEIWKWLVEGFKVISKNTKIIYSFDGGEIKGDSGYGPQGTTNSFSDVSAYEKYKEPPQWHEFKTKKRVLCNVDDSFGNTDVAFVVSFDGTIYKDTAGREWLFAEPVSLDDMTKYIWECE
jgi:hypothetical protein